MHIPDGFLGAKTIIGTTVLSAGALGVAVKLTQKKLQDRQIPFMGVMAAFIFAAQMVNFPVIGGTSGHLIGATLAAVLFGPAMASIIITTVLFVQCIVFQDGGLTVLGANIFNMAIVSVYLSYMFYYLLSKVSSSKTANFIAVFVASWVSVLSAALMASVELALSGTVPFKTVLPAMVSWHVFIGIGEGLITAAVLSYIASLNIKSIPQIQDAR